MRLRLPIWFALIYYLLICFLLICLNAAVQLIPLKGGEYYETSRHESPSVEKAVSTRDTFPSQEHRAAYARRFSDLKRFYPFLDSMQIYRILSRDTTLE